MLTIENVAAICHAANRELSMTQPDFSPMPWELTPRPTQDSVIACVMFHVKHPEATPAESHENWLAHKTADGSR